MMHVHGGELKSELTAQSGEEMQQDRGIQAAGIADTEAATGGVAAQELGDQGIQRHDPKRVGRGLHFSSAGPSPASWA